LAVLAALIFDTFSLVFREVHFQRRIHADECMHGYLSGCIRDKWPKYVNLRKWSSSTISLSIAKVFMMSTYLSI